MGNKLSALGFGCMRFPKKGIGFDLEETRKLILQAVDGGVNYFDTAYIYGDSEEILGKIITPEIREKIYLATKMPQFLVKNSGDFDKIFAKQLNRLHTDRIEYYLTHMLTSAESWERMKSFGIEEWAALHKSDGSIRSFGFSYHGGKADFLEILDDYDWDFVQIQYNYLDEFNQAGREGLAAAHAKGIPVIIMEPLRGGKLCAGLPPAALAAFCNAGVSPVCAALTWLWNQPEVSVVLSGMNSGEQLAENIGIASVVTAGSMDTAMSAAVETAKAAVNAAVKVPCTACGYCMPCPAGVDIPTCFDMYNMSAIYGTGMARTRYMQNMNSFGANPHFAGKCRKCGKCESHCPQSIPIRDELDNVKNLLEPWAMKAGLAIYRKFIGIKK